MHPEAYAFLTESLSSSRLRYGDGINVLEFGSRDVNGSPRQLFTSNVNYIGVDIEGGPGVDLVGDAADITVFDPADRSNLDNFDVVICMEVAEHTPRWIEILTNAHRHLKKGGIFIFTAACEPRLPHSAVDGHNMEPHEYNDTWPGPRGQEGREYYLNISPVTLESVLRELYLGSQVQVKTHPRGDVYAKAVK